jgi:hypothetical protein
MLELTHVLSDGYADGDQATDISASTLRDAYGALDAACLEGAESVAVFAAMDESYQGGRSLPLAVMSRPKRNGSS